MLIAGYYVSTYRLIIKAAVDTLGRLFNAALSTAEVI
jgi:hypothetical protein